VSCRAQQSQNINRSHAFRPKGARAIEFYKAAFGVRELFRIDAEDAEFWVADKSPPHGNISPEPLGGGIVRMVTIMNDPDAAFNRAVRREPPSSGR
jgi:hypothetical protein